MTSRLVRETNQSLTMVCEIMLRPPKEKNIYSTYYFRGVGRGGAKAAPPQPKKKRRKRGERKRERKKKEKRGFKRERKLNQSF